jgi:hypothetical protein
MKNFIKFNVMITPKLVVALFWLGSVGMFLAYWQASWYRYKINSMNGIYELVGLYSPFFITDIAIIFLSIVVLRIICELMIVIFKINTNLQVISQIQSSSQANKNVESDNI